MSLASLLPTATSWSPPAGNGIQELFWRRIYISLYGNDAAFDAWAAAATGDDAWYAARYSGYVMYFVYINTSNGNGTDILWKSDENGNGWCIQDARDSTLLGGYCVFPVQSDNTGASAETV